MSALTLVLSALAEPSVCKYGADKCVGPPPSSISVLDAVEIAINASGLTANGTTLSAEDLPAMLAIGLALSCALMLCSLGVIMVLWRPFLWLLVSVIDSLVAAVLRGPAMQSAIADLIGGLLKRPAVHEAISDVVGGVLRDDGMRDEIDAVIASVLRDDGVVRTEIATIVRGVLTDGSMESIIGKVVGGCLNDATVANGIVGAIKGTSLNVLNEASEAVTQRLPGFARRRLTSGGRTPGPTPPMTPTIGATGGNASSCGETPASVAT